MRVLYRDYDNGKTSYKWGKVLKDKIIEAKIRIKDGTEIYEVPYFNVLKVEKTYRSDKYIICHNCGELIKNTEEDKIKHFLAREKNADCSKCGDVWYNATSDAEETVKVFDDGTFKKVRTTKGTIFCDKAYYTEHRAVSQAKEHGICKFTKCRVSNKFISAEDVIPKLERPTELLSEKFIIENGFVSNGHYGLYSTEYRRYRYKNRDLYALVDTNGIVAGFLSGGALFNYLGNGNCVRYSGRHSEGYCKIEYFSEYTHSLMKKLYKED